MKTEYKDFFKLDGWAYVDMQERTLPNIQPDSGKRPQKQ
jgi:hypothetical protein